MTFRIIYAGYVYVEITEEQKIAREEAKKFCQKEIKPHAKAIERGEILPYDLMRKFMKHFIPASQAKSVEELEEIFKNRDMVTGFLITIELAKVSPSLALTMGSSLGLWRGDNPETGKL